MAAENITVIVRIKARADSKERVRRELQELLAPTRQEQGCINYDMHVAKDDDALFLFHENWDSEGDLNRHPGRAARAALDRACGVAARRADGINALAQSRLTRDSC